MIAERVARVFEEAAAMTWSCHRYARDDRGIAFFMTR
jgi:hypothetical protein